jgi:cytochrome c peroxidase
MKKSIVFSIIGFAVVFISFKANQSSNLYIDKYNERLNYFKQSQNSLLELIGSTDLTVVSNKGKIKKEIEKNRVQLKGLDFWFRYLEPTVYKKVNGPLPVEWETEVFEKFEKPYKREGAGLTLAEIYLEEETIDATELKRLVKLSYESLATYSADSITVNLKKQDHFFLCNRLYLLNLAAIYTTGFECPDTSNVIVELQSMMKSVKEIYLVFDESFPSNKLTNDYVSLYEKAIKYVDVQSKDYSSFDHFTFIKEYINPLYVLNQNMIKDYNVVSRSMIDYSLNKNVIRANC